MPVAGNAKATSVPQVDGGHWDISKCGASKQISQALEPVIYGDIIAHEYITPDPDRVNAARNPAPAPGTDDSVEELPVASAKLESGDNDTL